MVASELPGIEPRQRLDLQASGLPDAVALTLDACGAAYDAELIATLVRLRTPATVFVTRRWVDAHPQAVRELLAHPELFELQNHGTAHVPALVGATLYGMRGPRDLAGVEHEIEGGAQAIQRLTGRRPTWYRGAGARYDAASLQLIARLGLQLAGYSLNVDDGGTASAVTAAQRVRRATPGDILIAHLNRPASGTAEGLAAALPELQQRGLRFVRLSQVRGLPPLPAMPASAKGSPRAASSP